MDEFLYQLKVPKDRIAVLIGTNGETKQELESCTKTSIKIDSKEGEVSISGDDAIRLFTTREIIKAVARGFNPETAKLLLKVDCALEIIDLTGYAKGKKNHLIRLKGRVIGEKGKSRKIIEDMTECYISVYGKTVSIIGLVNNLSTAKKAVESLLSGSPHSAVYKWLEKKRREDRRQQILKWTEKTSR